MMFTIGSESWWEAIKVSTERVCKLYQEFQEQGGYRFGFETLAYRNSRTLVKEIRDYVYHNCIDIALGRVFPESQAQKYVQDSMKDIVLSGEYYEFSI